MEKQTGIVHRGPGQEVSTVDEWNHKNITGIIYRASVISVKWDVCIEPKGY